MKKTMITFFAASMMTAPSFVLAQSHGGEVHDGYNQETGEFVGNQMDRELDAANAIREIIDRTSGFTIKNLNCGMKMCSFKFEGKTYSLKDAKQVANIKSFLVPSGKAKTLTCDLTRDKSPICTAK